MRTTLFVGALLVAGSVVFAQVPKPIPPEPSPAPTTAPQGAQNQPAFVREAQQKVREGKLDEALAIYQKELQAAPDSFQANNQAGVVLDLMGKYDEART